MRYKVPDLMKFPDCGDLSDRGSCTWLSISVCKGKQCIIKRTAKENSDSLQYVYKRLSSLDSSIQSHICKKYYQGSMPWKDEKDTFK